MSYSVFVSAPLVELVKDKNDISIDQANVEGETYFYLSEGIASGVDMYDYWIKPAIVLNLKLLKSLDNTVLALNSDTDIDELLSEFRQLEDYWRENIEDEIHYGKSRLEWLLERSNIVKKAAQVAKEKQATLSIA